MHACLTGYQAACGIRRRDGRNKKGFSSVAGGYTTEVPTIRAELLHVILLTKIYDRIVPTDKIAATSGLYVLANVSKQ